MNLNCSTGTVWGAGTIWAFPAIAFALVQVFNVQAAFAQPGNEPVPNYSFQQAMDRALSDNPALAATRARLAISDAEIRAAGFHPNPSFLTSYTPAEDLYRLGVQQTIQLGFKRERRISLARAQRDVVRAEINVAVLDLRVQLQREQTSQENRIRAEVTAAYAAFVGQHRRLELYERELLPQSDTLVTKARRSFEIGKSPILVPITAQQACTNTRQGYLQGLADYQNAITDLERAVGTIL